jgi:NADPH:quinone reductase-like Zn-dependent oxidoreductase
MKAVVTTGNGGYDKLLYCDVPAPRPLPREVLVQVLAAGVNNTDINTRVGWYSSGNSPDTAIAKRGWNAATPFPLIQGTDCCGRVVAAGAAVERNLIGSRVLVRPCMRPAGFGSLESLWMGSDFNGAFAQFLTVPATEVFPVNCDWSDVELGSIPCAYGTAENMLHRSKVAGGEHVLITGASGGVGSATVQLAKRRGAIVTAIAGSAKMELVRSLGADRVLDRATDIAAHIGGNSLDVVIDNVGGGAFDRVLATLKRGGRYVSSGAIGGPIVTMDMRTFYLRDLLLMGCTAWDEPVFANIVGYIERGELRPLVAGTFPLDRIADAQREFLEKNHFGKFVLIPPAATPFTA